MQNLIELGIAYGIPAIIAVIFFAYLFSLRRIVPTNVVHIVQRGKQTVSYGVGKGHNVYYKFPSWMPIIGVIVRELPVSNFDIDLHEYSAYDRDRVPFLVDAKAFFHIVDTNKAAEKVEGFDQLIDQLNNVVKGAVRSILAQHTLEDIMEKRSIFGQQFTESVNTDLSQWGVEAIKNIELMDIRDAKDSTVIKQIMAKRMSAIDAESRTEIANNKQKAENAELDSKQSIAVRAAETDLKIGEAQAQSAQAVAIAKAESEKRSGIAKQEAIAEIAKSEKDTTEKQMEVERTKQVKLAEITKQTAIIESQKEAEQMEITANANKRQLEINTNANKYKLETEAEARKIAAEKDAAAQLIKQQNEAKGKEAVGTAEAGVVKAKGLAEAEAKKQMELAGVTAQTTLAEKVGNNKEYQDYMIKIREIEITGEVNKVQYKSLADALQNAELKLLVNSGDVQSGMSKLSDLFTSKGGSQINGLMESLKQTTEGAALLSLLDRVTGKEDKK